MRKFVTCLAVFALVLSVGCGGDKADACSAGCDDGCGPAEIPAKTPAKTTGDTVKDTIDGAAKDGADAVKDAVDKVTGAAKDITYKCGCGKEKTLAADSPAPS